MKKMLREIAVEIRRMEDELLSEKTDFGFFSNYMVELIDRKARMNNIDAETIHRALRQLDREKREGV